MLVEDYVLNSAIGDCFMKSRVAGALGNRITKYKRGMVDLMISNISHDVIEYPNWREGDNRIDIVILPSLLVQKRGKAYVQ